MLSTLQKRVESYCEFLDLSGEKKEKVMAPFVTDETWVHHYKPEINKESIQCDKKGTAPP